MKDVLGALSRPANRLPKPLRWGIDNEPEAKSAYMTYMGKFHHNLKIEPAGLFIKPGEAHLGASADGLVTCDCCGPRLLEVKCPWSARDTKPEAAGLDYLSQPDENGNTSLKTTHKYYAQIQGQMSLMDYMNCDFVVWTKKGLIVQNVQVDDTYWKKLKDTLDEFYCCHIIPALLHTGPLPEETMAPLPTSTSRGGKRKSAAQKPQTMQPAPKTSKPTKCSQRVRKIRWPCPVCRECASQNSVACEGCDRWFHFVCVKLTGTETFLENDAYICTDCEPNVGTNAFL